MKLALFDSGRQMGSLTFVNIEANLEKREWVDSNDCRARQYNHTLRASREIQRF